MLIFSIEHILAISFHLLIIIVTALRYMYAVCAPNETVEKEKYEKK